MTDAELRTEYGAWATLQPGAIHNKENETVTYEKADEMDRLTQEQLAELRKIPIFDALERAYQFGLAQNAEQVILASAWKSAADDANAALNSLTEKARALLVLRVEHVDDGDYWEITEPTNLYHVERLAKALDALRACLEDAAIAKERADG